MKISKKQNIAKILLIRLSSMGDVILTTALVRCLRLAYPAARIDFAVSKQFAEVVESNPNISNTIIYDKSLSLKGISEFKKQLLNDLGSPYDLIIDLQRNRRSLHFRCGLGRNIIKIRKQRFKKLALVHFKSFAPKLTVPIPEIYFETISTLGIRDDEAPLELWTAAEAQEGRLARNNDKPKSDPRLIAIAPGAHHFTKRLPIDIFVNAIDMLHDRLGCKFVLLGGQSDAALCHEIANRTRANVEDRSGAISIADTAQALDICDAIVTNDTGVMHIAAARGVPVVAIFGSTVTNFGFAPYRVRHQIVEVPLPCRPCTHIGRATCPRKHFDCMNRISPLMIVEAVESIMCYV